MKARSIQRNPLLCCRYPRHGKALMTVLKTILCQHRELPPDPPSRHRSSLTLVTPASFPCATQAQLLLLRVIMALGRVCSASSARRRKIRRRVLCKSTVRLLCSCQIPLLTMVLVNSSSSSILSNRGVRPDSSESVNRNSAPDVQMNWLSRFLHIKPASKTLCFQVTRGKVRGDLFRLLRDWQR